MTIQNLLVLAPRPVMLLIVLSRLFLEHVVMRSSMKHIGMFLMGPVILFPMHALTFGMPLLLTSTAGRWLRCSTVWPLL